MCEVLDSCLGASGMDKMSLKSLPALPATACDQRCRGGHLNTKALTHPAGEQDSSGAINYLR